ncbi:hypothetical protein EHS25_001787 [Saitozyma podzolica]|uniref:Uncharacterized protein n=1 Tax=Saitozyma podzolica TaxID=1890683 RepID=A0A427YF50_9TREE|nr:hypothetical protein EHS25_001787 [Saitozyma podzolica]
MRSTNYLGRQHRRCSADGRPSFGHDQGHPGELGVFALAADDDGEHVREEGRLEKKNDEDEHCQRGGSLREDHGEERRHNGAKGEDTDRNARGHAKVTETRCEEPAKGKGGLADSLVPERVRPELGVLDQRRPKPGQVDACLGELAGAGGGDERTGGDLGVREAEGDGEIGDDKAGVRAQNRRGPERHGAGGVDGEAGHEGRLELRGPLVPEDPAADESGSKEVGGPVGVVQGDGVGGRPSPQVLDLHIEGSDQAVGEAPEEEQDGY